MLGRNVTELDEYSRVLAFLSADDNESNFQLLETHIERQTFFIALKAEAGILNYKVRVDRVVDFLGLEALSVGLNVFEVRHGDIFYFEPAVPEGPYMIVVEQEIYGGASYDGIKYSVFLIDIAYLKLNQELIYGDDAEDLFFYKPSGKAALSVESHLSYSATARVNLTIVELKAELVSLGEKTFILNSDNSMRLLHITRLSQRKLYNIDVEITDGGNWTVSLITSMYYAPSTEAVVASHTLESCSSGFYEAKLRLTDAFMADYYPGYVRTIDGVYPEESFLMGAQISDENRALSVASTYTMFQISPLGPGGNDIMMMLVGEGLASSPTLGVSLTPSEQISVKVKVEEAGDIAQLHSDIIQLNPQSGPVYKVFALNANVGQHIIVSARATKFVGNGGVKLLLLFIGYATEEGMLTAYVNYHHTVSYKDAPAFLNIVPWLKNQRFLILVVVREHN